MSHQKKLHDQKKTEKNKNEDEQLEIKEKQVRKETQIKKQDQPHEDQNSLYQRISSSIDYLRQMNLESEIDQLNKEFSEVLSEKSEINIFEFSDDDEQFQEDYGILEKEESKEDQTTQIQQQQQQPQSFQYQELYQQQVEEQQQVLEQQQVQEQDYQCSYGQQKLQKVFKNKIKKLKKPDTKLMCYICHIKFKKKDKFIRQLPCDHIFHSKCIMPWFNRSSTCPVCRMDIKSFYIKKKLGKPSKKFCLVIDLIGTLIFYKSDINENKLGLTLVRPFAKEFIQSLSKEFELIIYSDQIKEYSEYCLNKIDKNYQKYVKHQLYAQHNFFLEEKECLVQDLSKIGRDLCKSVLVTNLKEALIINKENCILIPTWGSDPSDIILQELACDLKQLVKSDDIRKQVVSLQRDYQIRIAQLQGRGKFHNCSRISDVARLQEWANIGGETKDQFVWD